MAVNKVVFGNETLIDLTADTVTAADLASGVTAHDASGAAITGTLEPNAYSTSVTGTFTLAANGWSNNRQNVSAFQSLRPFMLNTVIITPSELDAWAENKVRAISENDQLGYITFECETIPDTDLTFSLAQTVLYSLNGFVGRESTITAYVGDKTDIEIPVGVISISDSVFSHSGITSVQMPFSLRNIGEYAFSFCEDLESILGWDSEGSVNFQRVGDYAFSGCTSLRSLTFGFGDSEDVVIGTSAFGYCTALSSLKFKRSLSVTSDMFIGSENVTEIVLCNNWSSSADFSFTDKLTAASLGNVINALADVTEAAGTHTITIGSTNRSRLSQAQLDAAEAKGWQIL